MPCPHSLIGDPKQCSQCAGAVPRKVVYDEKFGVLTIDGNPASREFQTKPKYGEQQAARTKTIHVKRGR